MRRACVATPSPLQVCIRRQLDAQFQHQRRRDTRVDRRAAVTYPVAVDELPTATRISRLASAPSDWIQRYLSTNSMICVRLSANGEAWSNLNEDLDNFVYRFDERRISFR